MTSISAAFLLPWRTVHRSLRWLGGGIALLVCVVALAVAALVHGAEGWRYGTMLYAFGAAYFWMCVMACLLLVAIDARRLRLPGQRHAAAACLLLYGALTVLLPLGMFLPLGGDAATIALVAALAASGGLAAALLPGYAMLTLGFLPAIAIGMRHTLRLPFPGQPGFVPWGLSILAVLVVACALCWKRLLHAEAPLQGGLGSAAVLRYRNGGAMAGAAFAEAIGRNGKATAYRHNQAGAFVRLDGVGPQSPVLALRVALGDGYAPQRARGHWRSFVRMGLPLLLFIPAMAFMQAGEAQGDVLHAVLLGVGANVVGWLGVMGGLALMTMGSLRPAARWRHANAELPLLALLPGLGDAAAQRRHLLRAALGQPLALHALLLATVLGAALAMHAAPLMLLFVALAQLGCAATAAALALTTFGGAPLPGWALGVLLTAMALLVAASTFVPVFATLGRHPQALGAYAVAGLAIAWAGAATLLLWLGRRGWRGLQRRPHPFLGN